MTKDYKSKNFISVDGKKYADIQLGKKYLWFGRRIVRIKPR